MAEPLILKNGSNITNNVTINSVFESGSSGVHTTSSVGIGTTTVVNTLTVSGVTTTAGLYVSGLSTFSENVQFLDDVDVFFGTGNDTKITHDENNTTVRHTGTGNLKVVAGIGSTVIIEKDSNNPIAQFTPGESVELYHNGNKKFETTGAGVSVTGISTATGGFISAASTTAVQITLSGNRLIFTGVGIGSTSFILSW